LAAVDAVMAQANLKLAGFALVGRHFLPAAEYSGRLSFDRPSDTLPFVLFGAIRQAQRAPLTI
jgi:hypothetical protein